MGLAAAGLHSDARDLDWRFTGERFLDPPSGETVEVWYRPRTGERAYVRPRAS
jgi:hypothetical protein